MAESPIRENEATPVPFPQPASFPTSIPPYPITFTRWRQRQPRRAPSPINEEPCNDPHTPSPVSSSRSILPPRNLLLEFNTSAPPPPPPPSSQEEFNAWREEIRASFDFIFQNYHQLPTDTLLEWELAHPLDIPPILVYLPQPDKSPPFFPQLLHLSLMGLLFQYGEYIRIELARRAVQDAPNQEQPAPAQSPPPANEAAASTAAEAPASPAKSTASAPSLLVANDVTTPAATEAPIEEQVAEAPETVPAVILSSDSSSELPIRSSPASPLHPSDIPSDDEAISIINKVLEELANQNIEFNPPLAPPSPLQPVTRTNLPRNCCLQGVLHQASRRPCCYTRTY